MATEKDPIKNLGAFADKILGNDKDHPFLDMYNNAVEASVNKENKTYLGRFLALFIPSLKGDEPNKFLLRNLISFKNLWSFIGWGGIFWEYRRVRADLMEHFSVKILADDGREIAVPNSIDYSAVGLKFLSKYNLQSPQSYNLEKFATQTLRLYSKEPLGTKDKQLETISKHAINLFSNASQIVKTETTKGKEPKTLADFLKVYLGDDNTVNTLEGIRKGFVSITNTENVPIFGRYEIGSEDAGSLLDLVGKIAKAANGYKETQLGLTELLLKLTKDTIVEILNNEALKGIVAAGEKRKIIHKALSALQYPEKDAAKLDQGNFDFLLDIFSLALTKVQEPYKHTIDGKEKDPRKLQTLDIPVSKLQTLDIPLILARLFSDNDFQEALERLKEKITYQADKSVNSKQPNDISKSTLAKFFAKLKENIEYQADKSVNSKQPGEPDTSTLAKILANMNEDERKAATFIFDRLLEIGSQLQKSLPQEPKINDNDQAQNAKNYEKYEKHAKAKILDYFFTSNDFQEKFAAKSEKPIIVPISLDSHNETVSETTPLVPKNQIGGAPQSDDRNVLQSNTFASRIRNFLRHTPPPATPEVPAPTSIIDALKVLYPKKIVDKATKKEVENPTSVLIEIVEDIYRFGSKTKSCQDKPIYYGYNDFLKALLFGSKDTEQFFSKLAEKKEFLKKELKDSGLKGYSDGKIASALCDIFIILGKQGPQANGSYTTLLMNLAQNKEFINLANNLISRLDTAQDKFPGLGLFHLVNKDIIDLLKVVLVLESNMQTESKKPELTKLLINDSKREATPVKELDTIISHDSAKLKGNPHKSNSVWRNVRNKLFQDPAFADILLQNNNLAQALLPVISPSLYDYDTKNLSPEGAKLIATLPTILAALKETAEIMKEVNEYEKSLKDKEGQKNEHSQKPQNKFPNVPSDIKKALEKNKLNQEKCDQIKYEYFRGQFIAAIFNKTNSEITLSDSSGEVTETTFGQLLQDSQVIAALSTIIEDFAIDDLDPKNNVEHDDALKLVELFTAFYGNASSQDPILRFNYVDLFARGITDSSGKIILLLKELTSEDTEKPKLEKDKLTRLLKSFFPDSAEQIIGFIKEFTPVIEGLNAKLQVVFNNSEINKIVDSSQKEKARHKAIISEIVTYFFSDAKAQALLTDPGFQKVLAELFDSLFVITPVGPNAKKATLQKGDGLKLAQLLGAIAQKGHIKDPKEKLTIGKVLKQLMFTSLDFNEQIKYIDVIAKIGEDFEIEGLNNKALLESLFVLTQTFNKQAIGQESWLSVILQICKNPDFAKSLATLKDNLHADTKIPFLQDYGLDSDKLAKLIETFAILFELAKVINEEDTKKFESKLLEKILTSNDFYTKIEGFGGVLKELLPNFFESFSDNNNSITAEGAELINLFALIAKELSSQKVNPGKNENALENEKARYKQARDRLIISMITNQDFISTLSKPAIQQTIGDLLAEFDEYAPQGAAIKDVLNVAVEFCRAMRLANDAQKNAGNAALNKLDHKEIFKHLFIAMHNKEPFITMRKNEPELDFLQKLIDNQNVLGVFLNIRYGLPPKQTPAFLAALKELSVSLENEYEIGLENATLLASKLNSTTSFNNISRENDDVSKAEKAVIANYNKNFFAGLNKKILNRLFSKSKLHDFFTALENEEYAAKLLIAAFNTPEDPFTLTNAKDTLQALRSILSIGFVENKDFANRAFGAGLRVALTNKDALEVLRKLQRSSALAQILVCMSYLNKEEATKLIGQTITILGLLQDDVAQFSEVKLTEAEKTQLKQAREKGTDHGKKELENLKTEHNKKLDEKLKLLNNHLVYNLVMKHSAVAGQLKDYGALLGKLMENVDATSDNPLLKQNDFVQLIILVTDILNPDSIAKLVRLYDKEGYDKTKAIKNFAQLILTDSVLLDKMKDKPLSLLKVLKFAGLEIEEKDLAGTALAFTTLLGKMSAYAKEINKFINEDNTKEGKTKKQKQFAKYMAAKILSDPQVIEVLKANKASFSVITHYFAELLSSTPQMAVAYLEVFDLMNGILPIIDSLKDVKLSSLNEIQDYYSTLMHRLIEHGVDRHKEFEAENQKAKIAQTISPTESKVMQFRYLTSTIARVLATFVDDRFNIEKLDQNFKAIVDKFAEVTSRYDAIKREIIDKGNTKSGKELDEEIYGIMLRRIAIELLRDESFTNSIDPENITAITELLSILTINTSFDFAKVPNILNIIGKLIRETFPDDLSKTDYNPIFYRDLLSNLENLTTQRAKEFDNAKIELLIFISDYLINNKELVLDNSGANFGQDDGKLSEFNNIVMPGIQFFANLATELARGQINKPDAKKSKTHQVVDTVLWVGSFFSKTVDDLRQDINGYNKGIAADFREAIPFAGIPEMAARLVGSADFYFQADAKVKLTLQKANDSTINKMLRTIKKNYYVKTNGGGKFASIAFFTDILRSKKFSDFLAADENKSAFISIFKELKFINSFKDESEIKIFIDALALIANRFSNIPNIQSIDNQAARIEMIKFFSKTLVDEKKSDNKPLTQPILTLISKITLISSELFKRGLGYESALIKFYHQVFVNSDALENDLTTKFLHASTNSNEENELKLKEYAEKKLVENVDFTSTEFADCNINKAIANGFTFKNCKFGTIDSSQFSKCIFENCEFNGSINCTDFTDTSFINTKYADNIKITNKTSYQILESDFAHGDIKRKIAKGEVTRCSFMDEKTTTDWANLRPNTTLDSFMKLFETKRGSSSKLDVLSRDMYSTLYKSRPKAFVDKPNGVQMEAPYQKIKKD